jgi:hypothetical protein
VCGEACASECEPDHGTELYGFADALEYRVLGESYIEKGDLKPCEPDDAEEAYI